MTLPVEYGGCTAGQTLARAGIAARAEGPGDPQICTEWGYELILGHREDFVPQCAEGWRQEEVSRVRAAADVSLSDFVLGRILGTQHR